MKNPRAAALLNLERQVTSCTKCLRLIKHITHVAKVKAPRYSDSEYWGKPLPGFGDPKAQLLIIGLAPAAHGGNRTGRMFTGDSSGDWLFKALHETGFANQAASINRGDGLKLRGCYITAAVRCAPPGNKPTPQEIKTCSAFLAEELRLLDEVKIVLVLGRIAFDAYRTLIRRDGEKLPASFRHGAVHRLRQNGCVLVCSYHPSRQNTQTGRLTWSMWIAVFKQIRRMLNEFSKANLGRA